MIRRTGNLLNPPGYPMSSYLISPIEINSSNNENANIFRLIFLFSILFPWANSRFSVCSLCWLKRKLTGFARTEGDKIFDPPNSSVCRSISLVLHLQFPIRSFNHQSCVCNLALREIWEIYARLLSRAGFLKERMRKTELGIIIANIR